MNILCSLDTWYLMEELKKMNPHKVHCLNEVIDYLRNEEGYEVYKHTFSELCFPDDKQFLRFQLKHSNIFQ